MIGLLDRRRCVLVLALTLLGECTGCSGLSKPYPEKSLHAISVGDPPASPKAATQDVLRVERMNVAKPFDGTPFVYKVGRSQFTTDYYAGFVSSPDINLGGELSSWLSRAGLYSSVISGSSVADYRWSLESNITELYGDYSTPKPSAVLAVKFFLIDNADGHQRIRFQKLYSETEPLSSANPDELVQGWNKAYGRILSVLVKDLSRLPETDTTASGS
jgi:uncharacterized lipoprotein YmbA